MRQVILIMGMATSHSVWRRTVFLFCVRNYLHVVWHLVKKNTFSYHIREMPICRLNLRCMAHNRDFLQIESADPRTGLQAKPRMRRLSDVEYEHVRQVAVLQRNAL